jgi:hypothetical protein
VPVQNGSLRAAGAAQSLASAAKFAGITSKPKMGSLSADTP